MRVYDLLCRFLPIQPPARRVYVCCRASLASQRSKIGHIAVDIRYEGVTDGNHSLCYVGISDNLSGIVDAGGRACVAAQSAEIRCIYMISACDKRMLVQTRRDVSVPYHLSRSIDIESLIFIRVQIPHMPRIQAI